MRSNKSERILIEDLVYQIQRVDEMIALHQNGGHPVMVEQYTERRSRFVRELIVVLAQSKNVDDAHTFELIDGLIKEGPFGGKRRYFGRRKVNSLNRILNLYQGNTGHAIKSRAYTVRRTKEATSQAPTSRRSKKEGHSAVG
jgi:hypothetical protein